MILAGGLKFSKIRLACLAALLLAACGFIFVTGAQAAPNRKYASIVMDADTGMILHQRYADKILHPASLTKMMTLALVFEAIDRGLLRNNERIVMSSKAASMVPSKLDIPAGHSIRVRDGIYALVTKSANDVAVAFAEKIAGTENKFAEMMNRKALSLGMTRTHFTNASGLHDPNQISTARDMAKLGRYIIKRLPHHYRVFSRRSFKYHGNTYKNHNHLMFSYAGMDGIKTGYVRASGFNLVASATRNNRRLIGVVFGGRSGASRNRHMAKLLDRGFSRLNDIRIAQAKVPLPARKPDIITLAKGMNGNIVPASGHSAKWATLNPVLSHGMISSLIGEGDYDPAQTKRFETGFMAIAAHRGEAISTAKKSISPVIIKASLGRRVGKHLADHFHNKKSVGSRPALASYKTNIKPLSISGRWSVQIGAYSSRVSTDRRLTTALRSLPRTLAGSSPIIAPLRTKNGLLFRARLTGYSKSEAIKACQYLKHCIVVKPGDN
jgi:D-alanyl-D-alanine carboxypeptidase